MEVHFIAHDKSPEITTDIDFFITLLYYFNESIIETKLNQSSFLLLLPWPRPQVASQQLLQVQVAHCDSLTNQLYNSRKKQGMH